MFSRERLVYILQPTRLLFYLANDDTVSVHKVYVLYCGKRQV